MTYFDQNYADKPAYNSVLFVLYGYFTSLSIIGGIAKYYDISNKFTQWISKRSFRLYRESFYEIKCRKNECGR